MKFFCCCCKSVINLTALYQQHNQTKQIANFSSDPAKIINKLSSHKALLRKAFSNTETTLLITVLVLKYTQASNV